jgi:hypothetical protein
VNIIEHLISDRRHLGIKITLEAGKGGQYLIEMEHSVNTCQMPEAEGCNLAYLWLRMHGKGKAPPFYAGPIRIMERQANQGVTDLVCISGGEVGFRLGPCDRYWLLIMHTDNSQLLDMVLAGVQSIPHVAAHHRRQQVVESDAKMLEHSSRPTPALSQPAEDA